MVSILRRFVKWQQKKSNHPKLTSLLHMPVFSMAHLRDYSPLRTCGEQMFGKADLSIISPTYSTSARKEIWRSVEKRDAFARVIETISHICLPHKGAHSTRMQGNKTWTAPRGVYIHTHTLCHTTLIPGIPPPLHLPTYFLGTSVIRLDLVKLEEKKKASGAFK